MLIRSQNRELLISFEKAPAIGILETRNCGVKVTCSDTDETLGLGSYSTKEKALKVLDMIQEAYADAEFAKSTIDMMIAMAFNEAPGTEKDREISDAVMEAYKKTTYFQMPADNEVEV